MSEAIVEKGLVAFQSGRYSEAFSLLRHPAEEGNAEAQCILGNMYQLALGVEYDGLAAVQWYERAAEQGYGVASNNLAEIYRMGQCGVTADMAVAERWYHRAVEQGFIHTRQDFFEVSA